MRKLMLIFLMLCLPLQMLAAAERAIGHLTSAPDQVQADMAHVVAHAEHVPHHHHADGKVHVDNSQASTKHLLDCEKGCAFGIVLPSSHHLTFDVLPQATPAFMSRFVPEVVTTPPLRPPYLPA